MQRWTSCVAALPSYETISRYALNMVSTIQSIVPRNTLLFFFCASGEDGSSSDYQDCGRNVPYVARLAYCVAGYSVSNSAIDRIPYIDLEKIYVAGFALGGTVALHAAALDEGRRIAGVASFAGFTPMRTDTSDKPTGGIRRCAAR